MSTTKLTQTKLFREARWLISRFPLVAWIFKMYALKALFVVLISASVYSAKLEPLTTVEAQASGSLQKDLNEFINIIPVEDIRNLTEFFYSNDAAMRNSYCYLRDEGFKRILKSLSTLSLVKKFVSFLNDTGVNFAELGNRLEKIVLTRREAETIVGNCQSLIDSVVTRGANLFSLASSSPSSSFCN